MILSTTFTRLRQTEACKPGYKKLARHLGGVREYGLDTPIDLAVVLGSNGIQDTLWCFRAVPSDQVPIMRGIMLRYSADCLEHAIPKDALAGRIMMALRQIAVREPHEDLNELRQEMYLAYPAYLAYLAVDLADMAVDLAYLAVDLTDLVDLADMAAYLTDLAYLVDLAAEDPAYLAWAVERLRHYLTGGEP